MNMSRILITEPGACQYSSNFIDEVSNICFARKSQAMFLPFIRG